MGHEKPTWLKRAITEGNSDVVRAAARKGGHATAESNDLLKAQEAAALAEHMEREAKIFLISDEGDILPPQ